MIKTLVFCLCLAFPWLAVGASSETSAEEVSHKLEQDIKHGKLRERTGLALEMMIRFAVRELKDRGREAEAWRVWYEYHEHYSQYFTNRDLGDHKPLSQWIADTYDLLEFIFGKQFMRVTRLEDIKIINFALPVVFACVDDVDADEYFKHFQPLTGTIAYWSVWGTCTALTFGGGWFLVCTPAGWAAENLTEKFVAPKLNKPMHNLFCGGFDVSYLENLQHY